MPEITFTKENLLERKQLKAGWRKLRVKSVDEGPGKNDPDSTVWPIVFIVEEGEDAGVPINHWFSEKAMGRVVDFVRCFTGGQIEAGKTYKLEATVGQLVGGYCEYDVKQGWNVIRDFKPVEKGKAA